MAGKAWSSFVAVIGAGCIAVGAVTFADARLAGRQIDMTAEHLYTLSSGTIAILRGLKEPITLRLFYSRALGARIPAYGAYADQVRQMLEEYARIARGKIELHFYDPAPFSDTEDRAMGYGLQGVPVDQAGRLVYFGLAGSNLLDNQRSIAFFQADRQRFLEYDLTRLVYELSNPKRPVVGVLSSLPLNGDPRVMMQANGASSAGQPYAVMQMLRASDAVRMVAPNVTAIDSAIQVLLVADPPKLSQATLYAIDQFVMRGGRLMAMVDPYSEAAAATPVPQGGSDGEATPAESSDLAPLLAAWGVGYDKTKVVGDLTGAWDVRAPGGQDGGDMGGAVPYPPWFNIRAGIDRNDPATATLHQITVASPGFLTQRAPIAGTPDKLAFTPLLRSSADSGLVPLASVRNPDPTAILAAFHPAGRARVIAARVHGVLHSAFSGPPAGDPPKLDGKPGAALPPWRALSKEPANLVVVADADILADRFWARQDNFFGQNTIDPFSDNGAFVANLVGTLAGGDALLDLRARGDTTRPFEVVDRMKAHAEARFRATQQALQTHLEATEQQLNQLRQGNLPGTPRRSGPSTGTRVDTAMLTAAQRTAIAAARSDIVQTREKLRAVQFALNRNIARLETGLQLFDTVLVPALLAAAALILGLARRARARRRPRSSDRLAAHETMEHGA